MLDALKETVCQITVFMICAQAITHFRPKDSYEKYLRMLLGAMILIQIFQPFCKLFWGVTGQELSACVEQFQRELDLSMEAATKQALLSGQKLESMSLEEVQERLAEQENRAECQDRAEQESGAECQDRTEQESGAECQDRTAQKYPAESNETGRIAPVKIEVEIKEE